MCVVSMIGDHYSDKWRERWPQIYPTGPGISGFPPPTISREEFDSLRKEVYEMKKLLERAIEYDKRTNQPNCETEDKVATLKKMAEFVGVDLKEIFKD